MQVKYQIWSKSAFPFASKHSHNLRVVLCAICLCEKHLRFKKKPRARNSTQKKIYGGLRFSRFTQFLQFFLQRKNLISNKKSCLIGKVRLHPVLEHLLLIGALRRGRCVRPEGSLAGHFLLTDKLQCLCPNCRVCGTIRTNACSILAACKSLIENVCYFIQLLTMDDCSRKQAAESASIR